MLRGMEENLVETSSREQEQNLQIYFFVVEISLQVFITAVAIGYKQGQHFLKV